MAKVEMMICPSVDEFLLMVKPLILKIGNCRGKFELWICPSQSYPCGGESILNRCAYHSVLELQKGLPALIHTCLVLIVAYLLISELVVELLAEDMFTFFHDIHIDLPDAEKVVHER
jgi:hypothetical protein